MSQEFTPGIYTLFNKTAGKVVEFHIQDHSVSAGSFRPGELKQQWEFVPVNGNFVIRCMLPTAGGHCVYLNFEGDMQGGQTVGASTQPLSWRVSRRDDMIRIFFSNCFCLDLDAHSRHKIQIVQCKEQQGLQLWYPSWIGPIESSPNTHQAPALQTITHVKSGALLDLNEQNRRSVVCYFANHKEPNQQVYSATGSCRYIRSFAQKWKCIPNGPDGSLVQSGEKSFGGEPLYLTVEGAAEEGAAIVASPFPVSWNVRRQTSDKSGATFRLYWPGTGLVMIWLQHEGTPVRLAPFGKFGDRDLWRASPL
ncbi:hypothetical protein BC628DRAFT_1339448 [Trametes gibbosa]|nr:hypothetical protein BC628DRAFT_1339448 [Trametes gibbosa]